nr:prickle-like protein 4 isoform X2 [Rattus norvegicus]
MSVQNSDWSLQQDNPIFREPDPPVNTDSDSGHRPVQGYGDISVQAPTSSSLGPPCPDISQASNWPGFRTLLQQLPPQDSDERYCLALGEEELAQLRLFCAQRKQKSLGQGVARLLPPKLEGHTCEKCKKLLNPGEYGVFAARAGERCCWHRPCFACQACGQALTNLIYFYHDGHLYCGRHHAELLRPRCPACDQRCTEAEGRHWHENHFCCQDCAEPLDGGRYALPGGSPCCPSCFARRYRSGGSSSIGAAEGQASLGNGGDGADLNGREQRLGLSMEGGNLPGQNPSPHTHAVLQQPLLQQHLVHPPQPPDASIGARSSHRASLACELQGPLEPTRRGCGAGLAPKRGRRSPTGGRRRGPLG